MIKAILFDMDGVLIDAKEWHYEALNDALALFGMEISRTEHLTAYDGLPTRKKLELLTKVHGLPSRLHSFLNDLKQKRTMELIAARCRPHFHHQYALSKLRKDGYRIAVCSNSIRRTVTTMMENAALDKYLDFYLSNEDVKQSKPHPEIYSTAIKKLDLSPDEVLIVEDNAHGIQAAKAAGGHLLEVQTIYDVTYDKITAHIHEIGVMA